MFVLQEHIAKLISDDIPVMQLNIKSCYDELLFLLDYMFFTSTELEAHPVLYKLSTGMEKVFEQHEEMIKEKGLDCQRELVVSINSIVSCYLFCYSCSEFPLT